MSERGDAACDLCHLGLFDAQSHRLRLLVCRHAEAAALIAVEHRDMFFRHVPGGLALIERDYAERLNEAARLRGTTMITVVRGIGQSVSVQIAEGIARSSVAGDA